MINCTVLQFITMEMALKFLRVIIKMVENMVFGKNLKTMILIAEEAFPKK